MSVPLPLHRRLPRSLYLHIPFCHRRCFYCDFPVVPLGDHASGATSNSVANYLAQLNLDLEAAAPGPPLSTVYIGGGTPSLLSVAQIGALLERLEQQWGLAPGVEISLEIDPASFDRPWLEAVLNLGINRFSLGVRALMIRFCMALAGAIVLPSCGKLAPGCVNFRRQGN